MPKSSISRSVYLHSFCHRGPVWSLLCNCTGRTLLCCHTCEHKVARDNACTRWYLKNARNKREQSNIPYSAQIKIPYFMTDMLPHKNKYIWLSLSLTVTQLGDAVEHEAVVALAAIRSHQVDTAVTATHVACATLIHICKTTVGRRKREREDWRGNCMLLVQTRKPKDTMKNRQWKKRTTLLWHDVPSQCKPSSVRW